jgi:hypothetical protein
MKRVYFVTMLIPLLFSGPARSVNVGAIHDGLFPSERHARMADIGYLVGIWELTSRESVPDGQYAEATGTRSCVWVLDRTAIRCDDIFTRVRATDNFPSLNESRDRLFYVTFNEQEGNYEFLYMNASNAEKSIFPAEYDVGSKTLLHSVSGAVLGTGAKLVQSAKQKLIDDNQIREEHKTVSDDGYTLESTEIILRRMTAENRVGL